MPIARNFSLFLLPAIVQAALSFLAIPLTTYVLGAADFGAFALMSAVVGLGSTVAAMGSTYTLSAHFQTADPSRRQGLVSASLAIGLVICVTFAAMVIAVWPVLARYLNLASVPVVALPLLLGTMILSFPWMLASDVAVLRGQSGTFAVVTMCQSIAVTASMLAGLYAYDLGLLALFVSGLVGALVQCAGALLVLRRYIGFSGISSWTRSIFSIGPIASLGSLAESAQALAERSILSAQAGLAPLGIYNHSQQYRQLLFMFVKAVTRSTWPVTLEESRSTPCAFSQTGRSWTFVHIGLTMAGVGVALVGKECIALLTHDKFTPAYTLVSLWVIGLLIKHSGRAELGFLVAHNHTRFVAMLTLVTIAISVPCMLLLVPRWGVGGAVAALLLQDLAFRTGLALRARTIERLPFQDGWVVKGALLIVLTLVASRSLGLDFAQKVVVLAGVESLLIWCAYGSLRRFPGFPAVATS